MYLHSLTFNRMTNYSNRGKDQDEMNRGGSQQGGQQGQGQESGGQQGSGRESEEDRDRNVPGNR